MDVVDRIDTTISAPLKERFPMEFGENGNDRLRYLIMRGSFPDARIVVRDEEIIPDLLMLQPENLPARYRWSRNTFLTVEEIQRDLKLRMQLQIKPDYQILVFDATTVYRSLRHAELSQWIELMCNARQSQLIELY